MKSVAELLNSMDPVERELAIKADDAYDALYTHQLERDYGVNVVCNPGGDRSKIEIDGVVMDYQQFSQWLWMKEMEKKLSARNSSVELPGEVDINTADLVEASDRGVKKYLRDTYGHYLSGTAFVPFTANYDDPDVVHVKNINWGRKI